MICRCAAPKPATVIHVGAVACLVDLAVSTMAAIRSQVNERRKESSARSPVSNGIGRDGV